MSLFKKKHKKKEEDLIIDSSLFKDDSVIEDETVDDGITKEEPVSPYLSYTNEELISEIISNYKKIDSKLEPVYKDSITNKILSRVGLHDLDFNMQVVAMDKHVDRLKKECYNISRTVINLKVGLNLERSDLEKLHKQILDLQAYQNGIINQLTEVRNNSYGQLKISTISVTMNKTVSDLEKLYDNITQELKGFKSFVEASEYIFYNSGNFLDDLLNKLIKYIKGTKNKEYIMKYDKTYFLGSDVVISLEIKEWIDLYNKLKFVLKLLTNYDNKAYSKIIELYDQFEAKYLILMMRTESRGN